MSTPLCSANKIATGRVHGVIVEAVEDLFLTVATFLDQLQEDARLGSFGKYNEKLCPSADYELKRRIGVDLGTRIADMNDFGAFTGWALKLYGHGRASGSKEIFACSCAGCELARHVIFLRVARTLSYFVSAVYGWMRTDR
jgi:hypothetical protein